MMKQPSLYANASHIAVINRTAPCGIGAVGTLPKMSSPAQVQIASGTPSMEEAKLNKLQSRFVSRFLHIRLNPHSVCIRTLLVLIWLSYSRAAQPSQKAATSTQQNAVTHHRNAVP
jgi:hypothetical protein